MVISLLCNRLFFPLLSARGIQGKEALCGPVLNSTGDGCEADHLSGPKSASLALTDAASSSRMPLAKPSHRTKPGNLSALKGAKP